MPSRPLTAAGRARSWLQERGRIIRRGWPKNSWGFMDYTFTSYDARLRPQIICPIISSVLKAALLHEFAQNVFNWSFDSSLRSWPNFGNTSRHKDQSSCCQNNPSRYIQSVTAWNPCKLQTSCLHMRVPGFDLAVCNATDLNDLLTPRPLCP